MPESRPESPISFRGLHDLPPLAVSLGTMRVNKTGTWRNIRPVIDMSRCNGCMFCWKFCPDNAVAIVNERPRIDYEYCKGCGICAVECSAEAIAMVEEEQ